MKSLPRLIGVIHLPALPGSPGAKGSSAREGVRRAAERAAEEAGILRRAGFDGLILENFGDVPFYKDAVPPETTAAMAVIARSVREVSGLALGINILRNDARSALAVASVVGAEFIRVNVLSGVAATDQGIIEGRAAELLRERDRLRGGVRILADVHVKHARSLSSESLELAIEEVAGRGGADAVIVTGATTGRPVAPSELSRAGGICRGLGVPLYVGSGATAPLASELLAHAHGLIVGSALRSGGRAGSRLDERRARTFVKACEAGLRRSRPGSRRTH